MVKPFIWHSQNNERYCEIYCIKSIITFAFAIISHRLDYISVHPPLLDGSSVAAAVMHYIDLAWERAARCTLVQSAVLRSHVVCLSVRPSVCNVGGCDHIGWNSSKIISPLVSLGCSLFATPTWQVYSKGTPLNLGPKWPTPCWFERRRHSIANYGRICYLHSRYR